MKTSIASVLAVMFASQAAYAQDASPNPVEEQEVSASQDHSGKPADGSGGKPDAVTTATVSSRAMIDDVFGACRTVMELPGVRELLAAGAAADKTAPAQN